MTLNILESVEKFFESIKDFFIEHGSNPVLWIIIIIIGLIVFESVYNTLNKD